MPRGKRTPSDRDSPLAGECPHRKRVLAEHEHLTLTGLYNVLEKLRAGTAPADLDTAEHSTTV